MSGLFEITEEHYKALVAAVEKKHGCTVVDKDNAVEMDVIQSLLDAAIEYGKKELGIDGKEIADSFKDWRENFAVTLAERIYIPSHWSAFSKFLVLCHELQHVLQWQKRQPQSDLPSDVSFAWLYLTWDEGRVRFEVEAYRAGQLEFRHFLTRRVTPLTEMVRPLEGKAYLLKGSADGGLSLSRKLLGIAGTAVTAGVEPSTEAARSCIEIVKALFPELEGSVKEAA